MASMAFLHRLAASQSSRYFFPNQKMMLGGISIFAGTGLTMLQNPAAIRNESSAVSSEMSSRSFFNNKFNYPTYFSPSVVRCEDKGSSNFNFKIPEWISVETVKPLAGGLTFGGLSGFIAGYACKQLGKALTFGVGTMYVIFQLAATYDYVKINWKKVEDDVMSFLDTNKDGKVDEKDLGIFLQKLMAILSNDQAAGEAAKNAGVGGFAAMFLYGVKKG